MTTLSAPEVIVEDCGPFKRYTFPSGDVVAFKDETHAYYSDCKQQTKKGEVVWTGTNPRLTGVSTVVKPYDFQPDQLMNWAADTNVAGIAQIYGGKTLPTDPATLRGALFGRDLHYTRKRDEKAEAGKSAHAKVLHQIALGQEPDLNVLLPHERPFGQAIYKWVLDRDPEFLHAEQVVASVENGVAGTLDLRVRLNSAIGMDLREGIALVDAKARGFIPASAAAQVAGYDKCVVDCGIGEAADYLMILKLCEDGTYREIWVDDDKTPEQRHQRFLDAVRVYRNAAELTKQIAAVPR